MVKRSASGASWRRLQSFPFLVPGIIGALLKFFGLQRQAIQYDIGNPLTAAQMTRHQLSAGLYAPARVFLCESSEGGVTFEYDQPVSVFGQFHNADVDAVAQELDRHLQEALQKAAA